MSCCPVVANGLKDKLVYVEILAFVALGFHYPLSFLLLEIICQIMYITIDCITLIAAEQDEPFSESIEL